MLQHAEELALTEDEVRQKLKQVHVDLHRMQEQVQDKNMPPGMRVLQCVTVCCSVL